MTSSPDVLVIGGGIIGLTTAVFLSETGRRVQVVERGEFAREASWAGAGILPPGDPAHASTPADQLRAWGISRLPAISKAWQELTGIDNGYRTCGGIEFLTEEHRYAVDLWREQQIRCERWSTAELQQYEPGVLPVAESEPWSLPDCAQLRNPWHLKALLELCRLRSIILTPHREFRAWQRRGSTITGVELASGETLTAGQYLLASGAWAESALMPLGVRLGVKPVRGQIVLFRQSQPTFSRVLMAGRRYLVPRDDGRVLVGSTEEPEAGFEKANTVQGVEELKAFAFALVPGLRTATVETTWAGLRPGSPDGLPFLGPVPGFDNLYCAAGHFRAGVQWSLGTARLMTDVMSGTVSELPAGAFRLDRPPADLTRSAFRS